VFFVLTSHDERANDYHLNEGKVGDLKIQPGRPFNFKKSAPLLLALGCSLLAHAQGPVAATISPLPAETVVLPKSVPIPLNRSTG